MVMAMAGRLLPLLFLFLFLFFNSISSFHGVDADPFLVNFLTFDNSVLPKRNILLENSNNGRSSATSSPMPTSTPHRRDNRSYRAGNWVFGFVAGTAVGVATSLLMSVFSCMLLSCVRGRYRSYGSSSIFSPIIQNADDLKFLENDDVIASLEVIGRGGCGEVRRAPLASDPGKHIAIKKIVKRSFDGAEPIAADESVPLDKWMRQIRSEILTVGRIRHRNLLPLLAHVTRPDCHFLVYEFMKNGSLHDVIKKSSEGRLDLDWITRHKIATAVASGLEYLHIHHKPRVIHRDLKPANILLDDGMEARIADFGMAKEVPDTNTHMTTSNVAGTVGYIAPEYHQTLKFTTKCDVYSFGVILAVLVTGRFPSDEFFFQETDEISLVRWLRGVTNSADPRVGIDHRLIGNGYEEQMMLVLKIACFCTMDDPKERPSSKEVRVMLSQIVH
ncbi:leucine-rich repeat receptor-like serine/threonine/tyrosine-protein kinase SOBIR1 [Iris pallida]|uniref:Leucine-rich repeat receptor-like serine/threonine/tyrosine-protein kinase SOBIR1 n=1 Tax=Iris pallida TaxID=29817 RepID=A0AAX6DME7_IRIPA|nr:leucine-rich repeat receptor-like serine/threonine/tyrosine-protein kinase SOBIR1 [Iris pallida]KAJ6841521.1 leucine-rich repeat receptor-like serine/threonine/tyrosine-protein kinase SOBIR1 [Iris pallida]